MTVAAWRLANWYVADTSFPALLADAGVRKDCLTVGAGRVTDWNVAAVACVAVKAIALLRRHAEPVYTRLAYADITNNSLPARFADAKLRLHTAAVNTDGPADGLATVNAGPATITLAALPEVHIVFSEAPLKVIEAVPFLGLQPKSQVVKESIRFVGFVIFLLIDAVGRIEVVLKSVCAAGTQGTHLRRDPAAIEVKRRMVLIVNNAKVWVQSTAF